MSEELSKTGSDKMAAIVRGVLGAVPVAGPLAAEVITQIIPNQRAERIVKFVEHLGARLENIEKEVLERERDDPEFIDLLEDSFLAAARALCDERLQYLATLLANSMTKDALTKQQAKTLVSLLKEINDAELIILQSHVFWSRNAKGASDFYRKHDEVLKPRYPAIGASQEERDEAAIYRSYTEHLVRLGLLKPRFETAILRETPELDSDTGMVKAYGHELTDLGRLLLRAIDAKPNAAD